ncbi:MAG: hypothetical protein BroJett003_18060 [Planctomycetota bacterium]|nr:MAG: hypothetical protein BroJett003_18060 [Planctomycetota bacterium]
MSWASGYSGRVFLFCAIIMTVTGVVYPGALLSLMEHLPAALGVVGAAGLFGVCLIPRRMRARNEMSWILLPAFGLGIGSVCLLTLGLGAAGLLHRALWAALLSGMALAGIVAVRRTLRDRATASGQTGASPGDKRDHRGSWVWLLVTPFAVAAIVAAAHAPGFLWSEEGWGYDALEYHLQMPREYAESGRIAYAPHNVYANFPANVEMLYLLGFVLRADVLRAAELAPYVHLLLAVLTVGAAWLAGREFGSGGGAGCGVVTASAGWLAYFCGLAYVENGLLFFGFLALACLLRARRCAEVSEAGNEGRALVIGGGAFAGLACGCKYPGVPMILVPLATLILLAPNSSWGLRMRRCALYFGVAGATFSPWLIKNAVMTGNPVFPLANAIFEAYPPGWTADSQRRWDTGHAPAPEERAVLARAGMFVRRVLLDPDQRIGPGAWILAGLGLWRGWTRRREAGRIHALGLGLVLLMQLAVWGGATHLYARFAVVFLIPLAGLAASAVSDVKAGRLAGFGVIAFLAGSCLFNAVFLFDLGRREFAPGGGGARAAWFAEGTVPGFEYVGRVNALPDSASVLLVGEARGMYFRCADYDVVFNENRLGRAVRETKSDSEALNALRRKGWTHVLVHWREITRLRRSRYGFDPDVTPELLARLVQAGLVHAESFRLPGDERPYVDLYELPR